MNLVKASDLCSLVDISKALQKVSEQIIIAQERKAKEVKDSLGVLGRYAVVHPALKGGFLCHTVRHDYDARRDVYGIDYQGYRIVEWIHPLHERPSVAELLNAILTAELESPSVTIIPQCLCRTGEHPKLTK